MEFNANLLDSLGKQILLTIPREGAISISGANPLIEGGRYRNFHSESVFNVTLTGEDITLFLNSYHIVTNLSFETSGANDGPVRFITSDSVSVHSYSIVNLKTVWD